MAVIASWTIPKISVMLGITSFLQLTSQPSLDKYSMHGEVATSARNTNKSVKLASLWSAWDGGGGMRRRRGCGSESEFSPSPHRTVTSDEDALKRGVGPPAAARLHPREDPQPKAIPTLLSWLVDPRVLHSLCGGHWASLAVCPLGCRHSLAVARMMDSSSSALSFPMQTHRAPPEAIRVENHAKHHHSQSEEQFFAENDTDDHCWERVTCGTARGRRCSPRADASECHDSLDFLKGKFSDHPPRRRKERMVRNLGLQFLRKQQPPSELEASFGGTAQRHTLRLQPLDIKFQKPTKSHVSNGHQTRDVSQMLSQPSCRRARSACRERASL